MPNQIDSLEIQIKAQATTANNALERLVSNFEKLDASLSKIDSSPLKDLSSGVSMLASAMNHMKSVSTVDFSRLTRNIDKLVTKTTSANTGKAVMQLGSLTRSVQRLGNVSQQASNIGSLADAMKTFSSKKMESAVTNIPKLGNALNYLFNQLANAPSVNASLIEMTNAMANLSANGQKVSSSSKAIVNSMKSYNTTTYTASKNTLSLAKAFGKFYASYFLVIRGIKSLWSGVKSSMDFVETFNYFNVTMNKIGKDTAQKYGEFGEDSAKAYAIAFKQKMNELTKKMTGYSVGEAGDLAWAKVENLGLDPNQLMNFQSRIGAVTNSVGLLGETSTDTAKALSMLAADMSSLTNTDLSTVMTNLSSGLVGQSRALYKYGIDITNATLATYALEHGVTKSVTAMSQAEKMQLRVLAILDQSKVAWGDQANTINSVANQYRVFQQQISNLGRILGSLFLPIVTNLLPKINGLTLALQRLFESIGTMVWGKSWLSDLNQEINSVSTSSDDLEDALGDIEDSLEADESAAKNFKKALQGFDELNILSQTDTSSLNNIADSFDLSADISSALADYESAWNESFAKMQNKAQDFANKIVEKLEPIKQFFANIFDGNMFSAGKDSSNIVSGIFDFMSNAIDRVDWEKLGKKIGEFLAGVDWNDVLDSVGELVYNAFKAILEAWFGSFKENPLDTLTITFGAIAWKLGAFDLTGKLLVSKLKDAVPFLATGKVPIGNLALALTIASVSVTWACDVWGQIFDSMKLESTEEGKSVFRQAIENMWLDIQTGDFKFQLPLGIELPSSNEVRKRYDDVLTPVLEHVKKKFTENVSQIKGLFPDTFDELLQNVNDFDARIIEWGNNFDKKAIEWGNNFDEKMKEWFSDLDDNILDMKDELLELNKNILSGIKKGWTSFTEWWSNDGVSKWYDEKVKPMFSKDKWTFEGIKQGLTSEFESAFDAIKKLWNNFADWINEKLSIKIDTSTLIGKGLKTILGSDTIKLANLPKFANGGFVNSADVFMANENGIPELVGTVGGRTAVASGTEITGISDAVYNTGETTASLLNMAVGLLQVIADKESSVSDDYIFQSFRRSATNYTNRTGNPAIPI